MHDAMGVGVGGQSSPIYDFLRIPGIASCILRVGEEDTHLKIMTSSKFHEMHHAMGVGVGAHSSQIYDFLRFPGNASCIGGGGMSSLISKLWLPQISRKCIMHWGGGGRHSSLLYVFIKIRSQTCATTGQTTSIITLGTIVQIWTQGGGGRIW